VKGADADRLGESSITPEELELAMKKSKPGKAPGPDGLPLEIYRHLCELLAPILCRVYGAVWSLGDTEAADPASLEGEALAKFLEGAISIMYKTGERTNPANYRPITLLNTDYRLLAKCLATRLHNVLPDIINPAQTAFVQGRRMSDNITLLQALPHVLEREGGGGSTEAAVVLCDFALTRLTAPFSAGSWRL
jgi:hypothetical protein